MSDDIKILHKGFNGMSYYYGFLFDDGVGAAGFVYYLDDDIPSGAGRWKRISLLAE